MGVNFVNEEGDEGKEKYQLILLSYSFSLCVFFSNITYFHFCFSGGSPFWPTTHQTEWKKPGYCRSGPA